MVEFEWVLAEGQASNAKDELVRSGGTIVSDVTTYKPGPDELDDYGDSQLEPLVVFTGTAAVAYLISVLVKAWKDIKYPHGYFVDASGEKLRIRILPGRGGAIVVKDKSGIKTIPQEKRVQGENLLQSLLSKLVERYAK